MGTYLSTRFNRGTLVKQKLVIVISFLVVLLAILIKIQRQQEFEQARIQHAIEVAFQDSVAYADSVKAYEATLPRYYQDSLRAGEGVFQVMERMGISREMKLKLINTLRFEVELVALVAGEQFTGVYNPDSTTLVGFNYRPDRVTEHRLSIDTLTDSISYELFAKETEIRQRRVNGALAEGSSLNESLLSSGMPQSITQVVNGILLCKIAFRTDARVNDTFDVILEEEFYNDTVIASRTKVLYAAYGGVRTGFHEAYRYREDDPKSTYNAHYTPTGEALIHSGLRYPVDRLHISSNYGMRIHPVTGRRKLHAGIDYAGPTGTPIYAVASGKVVKSTYDGISGNYVAIRHSDGFTSYYMHLSRRQVSVGQHVRSRQVIGKMGATGRVTGPHLHFGMRRPNNQWMNPNQKRMIATPKLEGDRLALLMSQMEMINSVRVALGSLDEPMVLVQNKTSVSADSQI